MNGSQVTIARNSQAGRRLSAGSATSQHPRPLAGHHYCIARVWRKGQRIVLAFMLTAMFWALPSPSIAEGESGVAMHCAKSAHFLAPPSGPGTRKYAPDFGVKPLHLAVDVTPDFARRTIRAQATLRFRAQVEPVEQVTLDAVKLDVQSLTGTDPIQAWQNSGEELVITYSPPLAPGRETAVTIQYTAEPQQGLYFRTPEMGYKEGDTHLFTQGESILARHWYPCFDAPNALLTTEIICRVPKEMTVISNGRLVAETADASLGLKMAHWAQDKPHANYLVTLVAGYFNKLEDRHGEVPLAFYTVPSQSAHASNSFNCTRDIMAFFEQEIGVPYPWPKFDQVCVNDFVAGGMENTTATTLTDGTLFAADTENIHNSEGLIAHEMAHQWFGDLVTCKDWSHLWLNEGFATYYETLYEGHKHGRDAFLVELYHRARMLTGMTGDFTPIVRRNFGSPDEMFGHLAYQKGSWVLHMLREQLGPELYRQCVKTFLERHRHATVVTEDFRAVIEELSGRTFDQFFDQWVYHGHFPQLEIQQSWDQVAKQVRISVRQVQKVDDNALLFAFPLPIRFKGEFGVVDQVAKVTRPQEDFYFPLESAPTLMRLDPNLTVLAKINFTIPAPMLKPQLSDAQDVVGRLLAVEQLSRARGKETVDHLKQVLNTDPVPAVRIEASRGLRTIHTDEALDALLACASQPDARVRRQVVEDIGGFYRESARVFALELLENERNPAILASAIRGLAGYSHSEVPAVLLRFLNTDSYRNSLSDAAIAALRSQDDPAFIPPLLDTLSTNQARFTSHGFAQGLSAVAYLARHQEVPDREREFLLSWVNDPRRTVQAGALTALGTLGDPKAIPVLEKFVSTPSESHAQRVAEAAINRLREGRKPADDLRNLRQEVQELQKTNRDLRREFDELKAKVEQDQKAGPTSAAKPEPPPAAPKAPEPPEPSPAPVKKLGSPKAADASR